MFWLLSIGRKWDFRRKLHFYHWFCNKYKNLQSFYLLASLQRNFVIEFNILIKNGIPENNNNQLKKKRKKKNCYWSTNKITFLYGVFFTYTFPNEKTNRIRKHYIKRVICDNIENYQVNVIYSIVRVQQIELLIRVRDFCYFSRQSQWIIIATYLTIPHKFRLIAQFIWKNMKSSQRK